MAAPFVTPTSATIAGISLERYRRATAQEVGEFGVLTATETADIAITPDARRLVTASTLQSDGLTADRYDGFWLYVCDGDQAGEVRRVLEGEFDAGDGSWLVDRPFSAPLEDGTTIELMNSLPAVRYGTVDGFREAINLAIEQLPLPDKVSVTIVDGQERYGLTGYPWPIKGVGDVYEPRADADDPYDRTMQGAVLERDGEAVTLALTGGFSTGTAPTFDIALIRPANTWIRSSGTWADSLVGLQDDADEAVYDVRTVVLKAVPIVLARMANLRPRGSAERAELLAEAERAGVTGALARWYGSLRGDGRQRVGATGGRHATWWWTRR